ncbi:MAG: FG-GAP-like repeat-containing protein [Pyrinomonadaceae bacterium]|nr:FG-GAP-like repeat-containing protein [Pyrinomonadaceae bacterium]
MPDKKILTKQTLLRFFTFLIVSTTFFGCGNSKNETVKSENVPSESSSLAKPTIENNEFEGDVKERDDWFIRQRKYPFDELPENARRNAWLSRPADAQRGGLDMADWQTVGPSPTTAFFPNNWGVTSGRINAVAVSPSDSQLVLIGAATGGIWRSANGGNTFTPVSDNHVDLSVGSIAFAPNNPAIVYAGMGDKGGDYFGTGVLKSTNGGQTWSQINNTTLPAVGKINKIQVDPANPNRVYVAQGTVRINNTTNNASGFWVSNDGGVNWQQTLSGVATDLVIHPTQTNTIYAGFSFVFNGQQFVPGGVFKSTNGGQNWTQVYAAVSGTNTIKVAVTPADPQYVYMLMGFRANNAQDARLEVSVDAGASWILRNNTFDKQQIPYNCYLFAHPTNSDVVIVGTRDTWASNDAGASYFNITNNFNLNGDYNPPAFGAQSHPDQHHFYISPSNPSIIYLANDGGLSRSTNNGASFQSLNATLSLTMFTSIDLHPTNAAISYGGTQDNGSQKRTGNLSWQEFSAGDGGQTVIDVLDPSIVFSTYIQHSITRFTGNGSGNGQVVGSAATFGNDRIAFYPPLDGNGINSNLYFGTYRLWVSTNRGNTWTAPGGTTDLTNGGNATLSAIGVGRSNINTIYTGSTDGRLSVSTDGGVSWINRSAGLPNRFIKSVAVNPNDANVAYVTVSGFDSGHVFKTTNAGAGWTDVSGNLPNIPTNTLLIDANTPTILYVGTDVGVFRSETDGNTWETFNTGMPPVIISELDMQTGGLIQAATYGRGAYQMTVAQACVYTINPATQNVGATAGSGSFTMTTAPGCQWQAASNAAWLTTGSSGSGSGAINFNYAANPSAQSRTGQITVGGRTFTLTQAGESPTCTYSISPTSQNFTPGGGTGSFSVTAPGGCAWTTTATSSLLERLSENYQSKFSILNSDTFSNSPTAAFPANAGTLGAIPDSTSNTPQVPGAPRDITFTVSGIAGNVSNVEVSMTGTHSWVGDVEATLIAPNGAVHRLFGYTGATTAASFGDGSDFGGAYVFKDTAAPPSGGWWQEATARTDAQPLTAGDYRTTNSGGAGAVNPMPATQMNAAFSGVSNANGVWTLRVTDGAAQDVGSITAANLTITGAGQPGGWLAVTSGNSGSGNGTVNYSVAAFSGQPRTGTITLSANGQTQATHTVNQSANTRRTLFDFDGDGKSDVSVFRPTSGIWYLLQSQSGFTGVNFGIPSDLIAPADYDGDGKTDVAVYRNGTWYLQRSQLGFTGIAFGSPGDIPMPADYDGDGKSDVAVFRPSTGIWYILQSNAGFTGVQFGTGGDQPVAADYDGDGKSDVAVFRPSTGIWYLLRSQLGFTGVQFGANGDLPTPADYDGDGKADVAVFRPSTGTWYLNRSQLGFTGIGFGSTGDRPAAADYDGDGKSDVAVFRPSTGTWYLLQSTAGFTGVAFGSTGDQPVPAAFVP